MRIGFLTFPGFPMACLTSMIEPLRAEFPDMEASEDVITQDRRRHTVSGAAAAFELALYLTEERLGAQTAHEVAC